MELVTKDWKERLSQRGRCFTSVIVIKFLDTFHLLDRGFYVNLSSDLYCYKSCTETTNRNLQGHS